MSLTVHIHICAHIAPHTLPVGVGGDGHPRRVCGPRPSLGQLSHTLLSHSSVPLGCLQSLYINKYLRYLSFSLWLQFNNGIINRVVKRTFNCYMRYENFARQTVSPIVSYVTGRKAKLFITLFYIFNKTKPQLYIILPNGRIIHVIHAFTTSSIIYDTFVMRHGSHRDRDSTALVCNILVSNMLPLYESLALMPEGKHSRQCKVYHNKAVTLYKELMSYFIIKLDICRHGQKEPC